VTAFAKIGYREDRHQNPPYRRLTVPDHQELAKGTLRSLIREAGLSVEEFAALL
jgi:predicted RNA binding protein YcfA (HicA-like mRNA interferase family)